jgi:hypothetical protein
MYKSICCCFFFNFAFHLVIEFGLLLYNCLYEIASFCYFEKFKSTSKELQNNNGK